MAKRIPDEPVPPPCQFYLVIEPGPTARDRLSAAMAAVPIASVLIRPRPGNKLSAGEVKPLVDAAQDAGVAAVIYEDAQLARVLRADGVHVPSSLTMLAAYDEARSIVGAGAIVGVDAGASRHGAMEAGEAGADYVAFGRPPADAEDYETREDLIAWWAEIFEIPCVAFDVDTAEEAGMAAGAGADFAALTLPRAGSVADTVALVRQVGQIIAMPRPITREA